MHSLGFTSACILQFRNWLYLVCICLFSCCGVLCILFTDVWLCFLNSYTFQSYALASVNYIIHRSLLSMQTMYYSTTIPLALCVYSFLCFPVTHFLIILCNSWHWTKLDFVNTTVGVFICNYLYFPNLAAYNVLDTEVSISMMYQFLNFFVYFIILRIWNFMCYCVIVMF